MDPIRQTRRDRSQSLENHPRMHRMVERIKYSTRMEKRRTDGVASLNIDNFSKVLLCYMFRVHRFGTSVF